MQYRVTLDFWLWLAVAFNLALIASVGLRPTAVILYLPIAF